MRGWRLALRIAWREAKRAKGRTAMVLAMITLPVAALAFAAAGYDLFTLTPGEQADRLMGTGRAVVVWPYDTPVQQRPDQLVPFTAVAAHTIADPTTDRLLSLLPPGSRAIPKVSGALTVHTASGIGTLASLTLDDRDPLAGGLLRQLSGRAPAGADEVALTPAAVERTGAGVGGVVTAADGTGLRVVGTVEQPDDLAAGAIVRAPAGRPDDQRGDRSWLVSTPGPMTWDQVKRLNTYGVLAVSRDVLAHPPSTADLYPIAPSGGVPPAGVFVLVAGLAMLEVVLLAGPAFAVGARRRRRDLGLIAATGGTPAQQRRIVLADGVVVGVLAAGLGMALGIATVAVLRPVLENFVGSRSGAFRVYPAAQVVVAGLAVLTGLLAAVVPAWAAARQDVVAALAGRRGITRSRRRWPVTGLLLIAAGAAGTVVGAREVDLTIVLAGVAAAELGLALCTPILIGLIARLGRRLPLAMRIALRDTSRNRTAAAPAISAVMAVVVGSLALGVVLSSQAAHDAGTSATRPGDVMLFGADEAGSGMTRPVPPEVITAIRTVLPVQEVHEINLPSCADGPCYVSALVAPARTCPYTVDLLGRPPTQDEQQAARADHRCDAAGTVYQYFTGSAVGLRGSRSYTADSMVVVVDDQAAGAVAHVPADDADRVATALRTGHVVVSDPRYLDNGRATLQLSRGQDPQYPRGGATVTRTITAAGFALPHPSASAPIIMLTAGTAQTLGLVSQPLTVLTSTTRMPTTGEQDRLQALLGQEWEVRVDRGAQSNSPYLNALAVVSGVVALAAAALATGLAAADRRADLGTLAAVGASPRVRRLLSLSQSGVIAGLGSVLGAAAGLGAAIAVLTAFNHSDAGRWPSPPPYPITVPWLNVAVALLAVPGVAILGAGLLTSSRLPIEHRR